MTDVDDWDYESPEEYEAAQRRAEEPPDWYLEEEGRRHAQMHRDAEHGGGECDCPPYVAPPCRRLRRLPRWSPHRRWHAGTPGGCETHACRGPLRAWRAHRENHLPPF